MSQLSLHEQLKLLFNERSTLHLESCLNHNDYQIFLHHHDLKIPQKDLVAAFTHTSFSHEYEVGHQELSEFLGDAVVQLIVTNELMKLYPHEKEGKLSKMRSSIVNEKTLSVVAANLGLGRLLLLGKGEFKKELYLQDVVLCDTLEALMAKVFQHMGYEAASSCFLTWLKAAVPGVFALENLDQYDAKSRLQEATLAKYKTLPRYSAQEEGKEFKVMLWVNEKLIAEGVFTSKKIGERELARLALENKTF